MLTAAFPTSTCGLTDNLHSVLTLSDMSLQCLFTVKIEWKCYISEADRVLSKHLEYQIGLQLRGGVGV